MMTRLAPLIGAIQRFGRAEKAVAAVEFALILPFMLMLYLGSIEVSQLISVDRKVASVASTVGDLVARANGRISGNELDDYFQAAGLILRPYPSNDLRQRITLVHVDEDGETEVAWSEGFNGAPNIAAGAGYDLPDEITGIARDNYVVVSEAQMAYQPWVGFVFEDALTMYRQYFHMPRFGEEIELDD